MSLWFILNLSSKKKVFCKIYTLGKYSDYCFKKIFFYLKIISPKYLFKSEYFPEVYCFRPNLLLKCLANFELPAEEGSPFNEILFVELDREKAKEVVDLYNKVGLWLRISYAWNRIPTGANFGQTDQWLRSEYIGFAKF